MPADAYSATNAVSTELSAVTESLAATSVPDVPYPSAVRQPAIAPASSGVADRIVTFML